jgi:hypothetical protein
MQDSQHSSEFQQEDGILISLQKNLEYLCQQPGSFLLDVFGFPKTYPTSQKTAPVSEKESTSDCTVYQEQIQEVAPLSALEVLTTQPKSPASQPVETMRTYLTTTKAVTEPPKKYDFLAPCIFASAYLGLAIGLVYLFNKKHRKDRKPSITSD